MPVPAVKRATFYVGLTRARNNAVLLTDDRTGLAEALEARIDEEPSALEMIGAQFGEDGPAAALPEREAHHPELGRWEAFARVGTLGGGRVRGCSGSHSGACGVRQAAREHAAMRRAERLPRELRGLLRERAGVPDLGALVARHGEAAFRGLEVRLGRAAYGWPYGSTGSTSPGKISVANGTMEG